jgi:putative oxidoreductase
MQRSLDIYGSLVARLAVAAIFVHSGWAKLGALAETSGALAAMDLPAPQALALAAALVELGGGLALALGFRARWAALALAAFLLPATALFHSPAGLDAAAAHLQVIHVYKNLAIAGGLLAFASFGPGPLALDARAPQPRQPGRLGFRSISEALQEPAS